MVVNIYLSIAVLYAIYVGLTIRSNPYIQGWDFWECVIVDGLIWPINVIAHIVHFIKRFTR